MKKETTSERAGVIGIVKTPLRFFTLACLVIETSLGGLALKLSGQPAVIALWGMIGTLVLLIVVVALIATFRPEALGSDTDRSSVNNASAVAGKWWELNFSESNFAVSWFDIVAGRNGQLHLEGTAYNRGGKQIATWHSEWACLNDQSGELFYFWVGDENAGETADEDFSGVGYFHFSPPSVGAAYERGTGWYTYGDLRELRLEGKRKIEVRRVSAAELKQMADDKSRASVSLAVYRQWADSLGMDLEGEAVVASKPV